jgi:hypothetical protein
MYGTEQSVVGDVTEDIFAGQGLDQEKCLTQAYGSCLRLPTRGVPDTIRSTFVPGTDR